MEQRMIDHWEVRNSMRLGDREVVLGVSDGNASAPYLVTDVSSDNPLGLEEYTNSLGSDDFLETMEIFVERIRGQLEQVKAHRHGREATGVEMTPLGPNACIPDSAGADYTGKVLVIRAEELRHEYRTPDVQLVLATHGNDCRPNARGQAVFCKRVFDGKPIRYERVDVLGVADPAKLPPWAVERLAGMREQPTPPGKKKDHELYR